MQPQQNTEKKILVLGGTGKTGSRIVNRLQQMGWPVRIGSRNAAIPFDWDDQSTWAAALQGIDSVYISYQPDLAVPGATDTIRNLAKLAIAKGVTHLVLLSGRGGIYRQCRAVWRTKDQIGVQFERAFEPLPRPYARERCERHAAPQQ